MEMQPTLTIPSPKSLDCPQCLIEVNVTERATCPYCGTDFSPLLTLRRIITEMRAVEIASANSSASSDSSAEDGNVGEMSIK